MENITTIIVSITAIITALTSLVVTIMKSKEKITNALPKKIPKQCDIDIQIINRMETLKEYLNADRVQFYDFHNGGHYANGRSALKTSCSYEVVRSGVKSYQKELQAVPLNCIPKFVKALLDKKELRVNNLEELKETMPATYGLKKGQEIVSFFDIILNNRFGEPIGFLAIQYSKPNCVDFSKDEENQILRLKFFIEENLEKMIKK